MVIPRMSAGKSRLLAYIKHTPGFENHVWEYVHLSVAEILTKVAQQDHATYRECIRRFNLPEPEAVPT